MNESNGFDNVINNMIEYASNNINCMYLGKITKLKPPHARIQPLAMINGKKQPPVDKVPFITLPITYTKNYNDDMGNNTKQKKMKLREPKLDYHKGDNVLVGVMNLDNMYFKNKSTFKVNSVRKHSLDFSIVLGKYASKDDFKGEQ